VVDDESCESMKPVGEAPLVGLGVNTAILRIQYMMQPVVQPVVQLIAKPVVQRVVSCKGVLKFRIYALHMRSRTCFRRPGRPPMRIAWRSAFRSYKITRFWKCG